MTIEVTGEFAGELWGDSREDQKEGWIKHEIETTRRIYDSNIKQIAEIGPPAAPACEAKIDNPVAKIADAESDFANGVS